MRIASPFLIISVTLSLLLARPAQPPAPPAAEGGPPRTATVEPLPPVVIDIQFDGLRRTARGWHGLLVLTVEAGEGVREASMRLLLPDGVSAGPGPWMNDLLNMPLAAGVPRRHVIPLNLQSDGAHSIGVEAIVDFTDGTSHRTRQGRTLHAGRHPGEGRHRLGAYEVMGVLVEEPSP